MERTFGRKPHTPIQGVADNPLSFPGLWEGEVVSIRDPDKRGRVRVRIYEIHDSDTPVDQIPWADPCMPTLASDLTNADHSGGMFQVPPIGSQAFIMFRKGNPEFPVWMGCYAPQAMPIKGREGYSNKTRRAALYNVDGVPSCPTWGSMGGHRVEMDDDAQELRLTTPGGMKITLSDKSSNEHGECIKLEDFLGNYIWMDTGNSRLTIRWDGDVVEEITGNRSITVSKDMRISVGGDLDISVQGNENRKIGVNSNIDTTGLLNLNCSKANPQAPSTAEQGQKFNGLLAAIESLGSQIRNNPVGDARA